MQLPLDSNFQQFRSACRWYGLLAVALCLAGCNRPEQRARVEPSEVSSFVDLMMPAELEIESFTKIVSFNERRTADGLEVIIRALDAAGDPTKVVGTFNIELYRQPVGANAGQIGQRLSSWNVSTNEPESFVQHWERFGRFYRFTLRLDTDDLPAGQYKVNAWVELPNGTRLFAERELLHSGSPVPGATRL